MRVLRALPALLLAAACATGAGATGGQAVSRDEAAGPAGGAQATDFTLRDVEGRNVRLSDFAGKVVLIDFWATWCQPCEAEIPYLQEIYERRKADGFELLAISMDGPESIAQVGPFARKYGLTFPVLLDEETRVVSIYNPKRTAPLQVIVGRDGRVARVRQGYNVGDEKLLEEEIVRLLEAK